MSKLSDFVATVAPTVASALLGPLGGVAVTGLGKCLGLDSPTVESITKVIESGRVSQDQLAEIRKLEMEYQDHDNERQFKYRDLEFRDRDSARRYNTEGGIQYLMFCLSLVLLVACLGMEGWVLFKGYPNEIPEIIVGRVLGLADAVTMLVLSYHYGTTQGSQQKSQLLAASSPAKV